MDEHLGIAMGALVPRMDAFSLIFAPKILCWSASGLCIDPNTNWTVAEVGNTFLLCYTARGNRIRKSVLACLAHYGIRLWRMHPNRIGKMQVRPVWCYLGADDRSREFWMFVHSNRYCNRKFVKINFNRIALRSLLTVGYLFWTLNSSKLSCFSCLYSTNTWRWYPVPRGGNGCKYGTISSPFDTSPFGIFPLEYEIKLSI